MADGTVIGGEIAKFSAIAEEWWDEKGKFRPLHLLNPLRIAYIREKAISHFNLPGNLAPFKGLKILDIGCGGGLLSEPMARLGGEVTGIDAAEKNIEIAQAHLKESGLKVNYRTITAEELAKTGEKFDIILNMEVIEHVADIPLFLNSCAALLKANGIMFIATINRTLKSYLFAIIGAEYILRLLPKNTHEWKRFLKPSEINRHAGGGNLKLKHMTGVAYNPLSENFKLTDDLSVNYMMFYAR
jgi:2-polyprenyl-6-hydroxyphenyl methylase/3-demethylubiquinone-9 3-methyltransferase